MKLSDTIISDTITDYILLSPVSRETIQYLMGLFSGSMLEGGMRDGVFLVS